MKKKDPKELSLEDDVQAVISMIPKLKKLLKAHKEATKEYQKFRKNDGDEIPGLEKLFGSSENSCKNCGILEETALIVD